MKQEEIDHIKSLAEKDPVIKKLWEFYSGTTMDGVKAVRATLNAKLLQLNDDLAKPDTNYDFALDQINEIARTLKKLPKDKEEVEKPSIVDKAKEEIKKGSFLDRQADKKRSE